MSGNKLITMSKYDIVFELQFDSFGNEVSMTVFNGWHSIVKTAQKSLNSTTIKSIPQIKSDANINMNSDLDTRAITTRLGEFIKNQITINDTILTLRNRILKLKKTLKEKDDIIQNLKIKINILEQNNKRASLVEICGELIIDVNINLFDIENVYRKLSNCNLEALQLVVEFSSEKKEKNSLGNGEKLNSKDQEYM
ncbi:Uncharacterized protein FWK35_00008116 [Aphis craccivora]|uniref:Uncharacterized protein n=1 Tax=Aphis craccivora TaxID=307492 RepID=A0A6G0YIB6_APHCR|nr:Uncharacterized protein FWK35_00008116 [Aphis craccivora]